MKTVSIFGSTGTIGRKMVEVVLGAPQEFKVLSLVCQNNADLIVEQAQKLNPEYVIVTDDAAYNKARNILGGMVLPAEELNSIAQLDVDIMGMAISGTAAITPSFACLGHAGTLAMANKETVVAGGAFFIDQAFKLGTKIIPVDSEHNAIYQCLLNEDIRTVKKIVLTCSGGPFVDLSQEDIKKVTVQEALQHPNWVMGKKITIDSATLINKALEIIEAAFLFSMDIKQVEAFIHRQSIIHGMVHFCDGSAKAVMGRPDMMVPIHYALHYPERRFCDIPSVDFSELSCQKFNDWQQRSVNFAYLAYNERKCIAFNVANEYVVKDFLNGKIQFYQIFDIIEKVMEGTNTECVNSIEDIINFINEAIYVFSKHKVE